MKIRIVYNPRSYLYDKNVDTPILNSLSEKIRTTYSSYATDIELLDINDISASSHPEADLVIFWTRPLMNRGVPVYNDTVVPTYAQKIYNKTQLDHKNADDKFVCVGRFFTAATINRDTSDRLIGNNNNFNPKVYAVGFTGNTLRDTTQFFDNWLSSRIELVHKNKPHTIFVPITTVNTTPAPPQEEIAPPPGTTTTATTITTNSGTEPRVSPLMTNSPAKTAGKFFAIFCAFNAPHAIGLWVVNNAIQWPQSVINIGDIKDVLVPQAQQFGIQIAVGGLLGAAAVGGLYAFFRNEDKLHKGKLACYIALGTAYGAASTFLAQGFTSLTAAVVPEWGAVLITIGAEALMSMGASFVFDRSVKPAVQSS